jgi:hypothetical protein
MKNVHTVNIYAVNNIRICAYVILSSRLAFKAEAWSRGCPALFA